MLSYLQKFNNLPQDLKDKISSPEAMKAIEELEKEYGANLAVAIIKVMAKEVKINDLPQFFIFEHKFDQIKADDLVEDLKKRVFSGVAGYLGIEKEKEEGEERADEWLENRKQEMSGRTSSFFFAPEDEEEIKELAKKLSMPGGEESLDTNKGKINRIVREAGLNFSSEDLENRFRKLLDTYLRGVRTRVDIKQALMKRIDLGGMGLKESEVDAVLKATDDYGENSNKEEIKFPPKIKLMEDGPLDISESGAVSDESFEKTGLGDEELRDIGYDFSKLVSKEEAKTPEISSQPKEAEDLKMLDSGDDILLEPAEEEKPKITEEKSDASLDKELESMPVQEKEEIKIIEPAQTMPAQQNIGIAGIRKPANRDGKIKIEDVKYVPKILGPVDELREMDLVNFRRLSQDPKEASGKLEEKFKLLEEESYKERVKGIRAWRQSPINNLYLSIGQESIVNNQTIEAVIASRKAQNQEYLTSQEFEAIMKLNKSLRF